MLFVVFALQYTYKPLASLISLIPIAILSLQVFSLAILSFMLLVVFT